MRGENQKAPRWVQCRWLFLLAGMVVFLPPLSVLFQVTQDVNFCGRWCPRMFFVWREGASWGDYFAGWLRAWPGVALLAGVLAATFLFGRIWCSHLCPVGGFLEVVGRALPSRFKFDYSAIPAPPFRFAYLLVYVVAPAVGLGSLCCSYCNFAAVPRFVGAAFSEADLVYFLRIQGLINLGLLLFLGVFSAGGRAYCNLLCPVGAVDSLMSRVGSRFGRRVRINPEACSDCGDCVSACPLWAVDIGSAPSIDQLSCIPCRLCEAACPNGAVIYSKTVTGEAFSGAGEAEIVDTGRVGGFQTG